MASETTHLEWYIPAHDEPNWDTDDKVHKWIKELDAFFGLGFNLDRTGDLDTHHITGWKPNEFKFADEDASFEYYDQMFDHDPYTDDLPGVLFKNNLVGVRVDDSGTSPELAGFFVSPGYEGPYGPYGDLEPPYDKDILPFSALVDFDTSSSIIRIGSRHLGIQGAIEFENEDVAIWRDTNDLKFKDVTNGTVALSDLVGGGGDYLPLAGGTMSGDIDMDGNDIINANITGTTSDTFIIDSDGDAAFAGALCGGTAAGRGLGLGSNLAEFDPVGGTILGGFVIICNEDTFTGGLEDDITFGTGSVSGGSGSFGPRMALGRTRGFIVGESDLGSEGEYWFKADTSGITAYKDLDMNGNDITGIGSIVGSGSSNSFSSNTDLWGMGIDAWTFNGDILGLDKGGSYPSAVMLSTQDSGDYIAAIFVAATSHVDMVKMAYNETDEESQIRLNVDASDPKLKVELAADVTSGGSLELYNATVAPKSGKISVNASDNLVFEDTVTGSKTLAELVSSGVSTLTEILAEGNSAGTYDINMNGNYITGSDTTPDTGLFLTSNYIWRGGPPESAVNMRIEDDQWDVAVFDGTGAINSTVELDDTEFRVMIDGDTDEKIRFKVVEDEVTIGNATNSVNLELYGNLDMNGNDIIGAVKVQGNGGTDALKYDDSLIGGAFGDFWYVDDKIFAATNTASGSSRSIAMIVDAAETGSPEGLLMQFWPDDMTPGSDTAPIQLWVNEDGNGAQLSIGSDDGDSGYNGSLSVSDASGNTVFTASHNGIYIGASAALLDISIRGNIDMHSNKIQGDGSSSASIDYHTWGSNYGWLINRVATDSSDVICDFTSGAYPGTSRFAIMADGAIVVGGNSTYSGTFDPTSVTSITVVNGLITAVS